MPRVSVVIPTYNRAHYLKVTIDNVLQQTYRDFEVIVIDDGSTDDTPEALASYGDKIRAIRKANAGPAAARNTGIMDACGELIAFLDDDDLWDPRKLDVYVTAFDQHPEVGAVYGNYQFIDGDGRIVAPLEIEAESHFGKMPSGQVYYEFLSSFYGVPATMMVRRECFARAGLFDPHCDSVEDWDMWIRIARDCKFLHIQEPLAYYRCQPNSVSTNNATTREALERIIAKHVAANAQDPRALGILRAAMRNILSEKELRRAYSLQSELKWRASILPLLKAMSIRWGLTRNPYCVKCLLAALTTRDGRPSRLSTANRRVE